MRGMLAHADLARYAGQFVWLELNLDDPQNRAFFAEHAVRATPTFFVIDSGSGHVAATQLGAMSLAELKQFLDRGTDEILSKNHTPADAALARGDTLLAHNEPAAAAKAYEEAVKLSSSESPRHELAQAALAVSLQTNGNWERCAETASDEASHMRRDSAFARTVIAGMWCVVQSDPAPWIKTQAQTLEPLAEEVLSSPNAERDDRDELYRTLMYLALQQNNEALAGKLGDRWLAELDAIQPGDNDERSAVDIARVENIQIYGDASRILPALIASERAMPDNYNASLRVAQMESAVKNYDAAVAACDRGLARSPGADGRAWLLQTKADALMQKGQVQEARRLLEEALVAAQQIPDARMRASNVAKIEKALAKSAPPRKRAPESSNLCG